MANYLFVLFALLCLPAVAQFNSDYEEAVKLFEDGKSKKAMASVDKAIKKDPQVSSYYILKARIHLQKQEVSELFTSLKAGTNACPDSANIYSFRGSIYDAAQKFNDAIVDYTMALERSEGDSVRTAIYLSNRGGSYFNIRQFDNAYDDLSKALAIDSTNLEALNNIAIVCDEVGRGDEVITYLEQVIAVDPEFVYAYVNLGFKYQGLGEHQKAIECFGVAIEKNPNEAFAYSNRATSRLEIGDIQGAMKDINKSITLKSNNSWAYKVRAKVFMAKGQNDKACQDLQLALDHGYVRSYGDEVNLLIKSNCSQ